MSKVDRRVLSVVQNWCKRSPVTMWCGVAGLHVCAVGNRDPWSPSKTRSAVRKLDGVRVGSTAPDRYGSSGPITLRYNASWDQVALVGEVITRDPCVTCAREVEYMWPDYYSGWVEIVCVCSNECLEAWYGQLVLTGWRKYEKPVLDYTSWGALLATDRILVQLRRRPAHGGIGVVSPEKVVSVE